MPDDTNRFTRGRFLDCPMTANWTRFDAYAQRIRSIKFDDTSPWAGWKNGAVKFEVLAEISLFHPRGTISPPNVRQLTWASEYHDSPMSALPFISKSVDQLHLSLGEDVEDQTTQKLIHFILQRPINLKSFSFESAISAENISNDLIQLISNSPQLESITLPRYYQTQTIVDTLGHLCELKSLQVSHKWYQSYNSQEQAMSFLNGRFPRLDAIEIDAPIPQITQTLAHFQLATDLRDLTISCAHLNNTVDVAALTTAIAQCCTAIQALSFNFRPSTPVPNTVDLAFPAFQPMLSCHNLQAFRIHLGKPFTITERDLQEMAHAWPDLRVLVLSPERGQQASAGLSWNVFPAIAGLFPNLEELSAYFSSTDIVSFAGDILPQVELLSLRKLGVGMSAIPNDHTALGFLIGAYCRLPISISNEPSVWERMLGERPIEGQWQGVEDVARRVQQAKQEIRKRWRFRRNMAFADLPPELLLAVFSPADRKQLAAAARVCQKWSTLALNALWRDLDSVVPLVELVVPLIQTGQTWSWSLEDEPTESQWNRYDSYAGRVRTIWFQDSSYARRQRNRVVTVELIEALVKLHPQGAFCPPRLRKLSWSSLHAESALAMVPFLCDTLEDLDVGLYSETSDKRTLIEQAAVRAPHLKSLRLNLAGRRGLESSVVLWLSRLQLLQSLELPTDFQTTEIVQALGELAHLTRLTLRYEMDPEEEREDQCFSFNPPPAFPRLQALEVDAPPDRLVQLFQTSEQLGQLKKAILFSDNPSPEQVFRLTTAVAQRCQGITTLNLELGFSDTDQVYSLSFQHTRPLLACRSLKILKFATSIPLTINKQDLEDMALAWPGIQELNLSSTPDEEMDSGGFPLQLLPIAAGLFPKLQILGIYIDPKSDALGFDFKILPSSEFQSLQVLDVGTSSVPIDGPITLGFTIGALCKLEVQIVGDFESFRDYRDYDHVSEWDSVKDIVTKLVKSKRAIHNDWTVLPKTQTARF